MFLNLVTLPTGSEFFAGIADTASSTFGNFLPIGYWAGGWIVGSILGVFVIVIVIAGFKHFFHGTVKHVASHAEMDSQWARHNAQQRYTSHTDDRSERGDFLHEGL